MRTISLINSLRCAICAVALSATAAAGAQDFFEPEDIITEIPAGETKHYSRFVSAAFPYEDSDFGWTASVNDGAHRTITFCENGDVYFDNPFTAFNTHSYLKGRLNGSKIEVQLPQPVYVLDGDILLACRLKYDSGNMVIDDNQLLTFYIKNDGTIEMEDPSASSLANVAFLALCNEFEEFSGYGDFRMYYYPVDEEALKTPEPEGLVYDENWVMANTVNSANIGVAITDDGDVYVKGIHPRFPDSVMHGVYNKSKGTVTFEGPVFLGLDPRSDYYVYLVEGTMDEYNNVGLSYDITFDYEGGNIMQAQSFLIVNEGTRKIQVSEYLVDLVLMQKDGSEIYAEPRNPSNLIISPYDPAYGYGAYRFDIQLIDTQYNYMEPENVFYLIYMNDERQPHVFQKPLYPMISKPMSQIPYGFSDGCDFEADGPTHTVFFNESNVNKIGVAVMHRAPDGNTYYSHTMWSNGDITTTSPVSVSTLNAEESPVISSTFYTIDGRRAVNPTDGMYILVETRADGSTATRKVVLRKR